MDIVLKGLPSDFPVTERPYKVLAEEMGIGDEATLIKGIGQLKEAGIIRRVAGIVNHRIISYRYNALVVWNVDEADVERVGEAAASFPEVTHCYERAKGGYWHYNLYTMVHGKTEEDCCRIIKRIAERIGVGDFKVFLSKRELKKTALTADYE